MVSTTTHVALPMPDGVAIKQGIELVGSLVGPVQKDAVQRADILLLNENLPARSLIVDLDWIRPGGHGGSQAGRQTALLCDLKRSPGGFVCQAPLENRLVFVVEGVTGEWPDTVCSQMPVRSRGLKFGLALAVGAGAAGAAVPENSRAHQSCQARERKWLA